VVDTGDPAMNRSTPIEPGVRVSRPSADVRYHWNASTGSRCLDTAQQQIVIVDTLAAADDLAMPLGRQDVDAQGAVGVEDRLHGERLDGGRPW
jgi:hypothetical protein